MLINTHAIVTAFFPNVICAPSRDHFFISYIFFFLFVSSSIFFSVDRVFIFISFCYNGLYTIIAADAMDKTKGNRMVFLFISSEVASAEFQLLPITRIQAT